MGGEWRVFVDTHLSHENELNALSNLSPWTQTGEASRIVPTVVQFTTCSEVRSVIEDAAGGEIQGHI